MIHVISIFERFSKLLFSDDLLNHFLLRVVQKIDNENYVNKNNSSINFNVQNVIQVSLENKQIYGHIPLYNSNNVRIILDYK